MSVLIKMQKDFILNKMKPKFKKILLYVAIIKMVVWKSANN